MIPKPPTRTRGRPRGCSKKEAGFSTLEALAAVAVLSVLGAALFAGSRVALAASEKARREAKNASALLVFDETLRRELGSIRVPYWERGFTVELAVDRASIPWYEGKQEAVLTILKEREANLGEEDEKTAPEDPEAGLHRTIQPPSGVRVETMELMEGEDGAPRGLELHYTLGGRDYETVAVFASSPLGRKTR